MKSNIITYLLIIVFCVSCKHKYTNNETILKAEILLQNYPDSAYKLLNTINNLNKLSSADYAAWCLHFTHAQYKLYLDIKSDSLIRFAVNYYDNTNIEKYSGTSYYLLGCIHEMNNRKKDAMYCFKKADDILKKTNNYLTKGIVNQKIGYLFLLDEYYSEAEVYFRKAIYNYYKSGNKKYIYNCYKNIAELQLRSGVSLDKILEIIKKSESIALQSNDLTFYYNMLFFEATVLIDSNTKRSKDLLLISYHKSPENRSNISPFLTYAYSKLKMADSARYYRNFTKLNLNEDRSKSLIQITNAYLANCERKFDSAFVFFEKAYYIREHIYRQNIQEQLIHIDRQYDLSKKEAEKAKLEIKNQKNVILIAFLSIMILAVLLILVFITNLNKKRQAELIIEKQQLEFEVKTKQVENDKKLKILLLHLQNKIDNTLHFKRIQSNLAKVEKKEEFIAEITRQSVLNNIERQFYIYEADKLFDGRIMNLKSDFPQLTDSDLIVISLICIGIDITNSILLLDYANINTMYIRRNRIKKHLGLDKSTDLEKWLRKQVVEHD